MSANLKGGLVVALAVVVGLAIGLMASKSSPAVAGAEGQAAGVARYNVVWTEGTNLMVTDNQTNTLYFYCIDRDAEVGADLKLRGTIRLDQVGKPTIRPTAMKEPIK